MSQSINTAELLTHMDWVQRLARQLVRSPEEAQDLVQDTWVAALESPPRERGNLKGWLGAALRNRARSTGRARRSRAARERAAARPEAQGVVEKAEIQHELVEVVLALEEPYKSLLLLRYFEDLSVREIAEREGTPHNTLRSQLVRAHGQVRDALDRRYADQGGRRAWAGLLVASLGDAATTSWISVPVLAWTAVGVLVLGCSTALMILSGARPSLDLGELALGAGAQQVSSANELVEPSSKAEAQRMQAAAPSSLGTSSPRREDGTILLEVLDEASGAPLAELQWIAYEEGESKRLLGRGRTDTQGRARIEDLPGDDVIIVRTERRAPHAPNFGALWLRKNATQELTIRAGAGGSLSGRVVDDLGKPLEGIHILADTRPESGLNFDSRSSRQGLENIGYVEASEGSGSIARARPSRGPKEQRLAQTDADGRWRIEHLASMPEGVWYVDGEARPERWSPVRLLVRDPSWTLARKRELAVELGQNSHLDVGELVFQRTIEVSGQLLSATGMPIPGALVLSRDASIGVTQGSLPFPENHNYRQGNLTDADGRFRVRECVEMRRSVLGVKRKSGAFESFTLEQELTPGEDLEGVVLRLKEQVTLVLELVGPDGEPIDEFTEARASGELRGMTSSLVGLGMRDGNQVYQPIHRRQDGTWTLLPEESLTEIASVEIFAIGYFPKWVPLSTADPHRISLRLALEPKPRIEIRTHLNVQRVTSLQAAELSLHRDSPENERILLTEMAFGMDRLLYFVEEPGSYWARLNPSHDTEAPLLLGPIETDEGPTDWRVDASKWVSAFEERTWTNEVQGRAATERPPSGLLPDDRPPLAPTVFSLRAVDSKTGELLQGVRILGPERWRRGQPFHSQQKYEDSQRTSLLECNPGSYTIKVSRDGYLTKKLPGVTHGPPGERVDLGVIRMTALDDLRARVEWSDGTPLAQRRVSWSNAYSKGRAVTDAEGRFSFTGKAGGRAPWVSVLLGSSGDELDYSIGPAYREDRSTDAEYVYETTQKVTITVEVHGLHGKHYAFPRQAYLSSLDPKDKPIYGRDYIELSRLASPDGKLTRYQSFVLPGTYNMSLNGQPPCQSQIVVLPGELEQTFSVTCRN